MFWAKNVPMKHKCPKKIWWGSYCSSCFDRIKSTPGPKTWTRTGAKQQLKPNWEGEEILEMELRRLKFNNR